jgi:hypothetical protein
MFFTMCGTLAARHNISPTKEGTAKGSFRKSPAQAQPVDDAHKAALRPPLFSRKSEKVSPLCDGA